MPTKEGVSEPETFVRISSVDFSGDISITFRSRPLGKDMAVLQLDLDTFDELDREIRDRSEENLINTGRKGCTTDEVYKLVERFFGRKLKDLAASNVEDVLQGREMSTLHDIKRAWSSTSSSASGYVGDAKGYTKEKLKGKLAESLGISKDTINMFAKHPFLQALQHRAQESEEESATDTE
ncbi:MAG: hypothetical protein SGILL_007626 [Bacillariaceae sp.]